MTTLPLLTRRPVTPGTVDTVEEVYEYGNIQLIFLSDVSGWKLTQITTPEGGGLDGRIPLAEGINSLFSYENPDYTRIDHLVMGHIHDIQTKWFEVEEARSEYARIYERFSEVLARIDVYGSSLEPGKRAVRNPTAKQIEQLALAVTYLENAVDPLDEVEDPSE
jgi:hypothetical protein